jgi:hypothetical protein
VSRAIPPASRGRSSRLRGAEVGSSILRPGHARGLRLRSRVRTRHAYGGDAARPSRTRAGARPRGGHVGARGALPNGAQRPVRIPPSRVRRGRGAARGARPGPRGDAPALVRLRGRFRRARGRGGALAARAGGEAGTGRHPGARLRSGRRGGRARGGPHELLLGLDLGAPVAGLPGPGGSGRGGGTGVRLGEPAARAAVRRGPLGVPAARGDPARGAAPEAEPGGEPAPAGGGGAAAAGARVVRGARALGVRSSARSRTSAS